MLNYGAPSWFYGEITEFANSGAMRRRTFRYRRSFMYAAVRVINYIAESVASWEKESGSVAKLWASNIRFGNIDSNVKTRVPTNVCLHVPTFCYKTQHKQRL